MNVVHINTTGVGYFIYMTERGNEHVMVCIYVYML